MKKLILSLCLLPGLAFANTVDCFYGGFKLSRRNMGFKREVGGNMFAKNFTQYSLFAGMNFHKHIGGELEIFTTENKKRSVTIDRGVTALGNSAFSGIGSDSYDTKTRLKGANLLITGRCPLISQVNVFGFAGIGISELKIQGDLTQEDGAAPDPGEAEANLINQSKTKAYPIIGGGLEFKITKCFGARADIAWEQTSRHKWAFNTGTISGLQVTAKDSVVYGLSLYIAI